MKNNGKYQHFGITPACAGKTLPVASSSYLN